MLNQIRYDDGLVLSGKGDDDTVADVEAHIRESHPGLAELITRDQILVTAREARFALRGHETDRARRVIGRCPFDLWDLPPRLRREVINRRSEIMAHTPECGVLQPAVSRGLETAAPTPSPS